MFLGCGGLAGERAGDQVHQAGFADSWSAGLNPKTEVQTTNGTNNHESSVTSGLCRIHHIVAVM